jgi:RES domain-containing protein
MTDHPTVPVMRSKSQTWWGIARDDVGAKPGAGVSNTDECRHGTQHVDVRNSNNADSHLVLVPGFRAVMDDNLNTRTKNPDERNRGRTEAQGSARRRGVAAIIQSIAATR